MPADFTIDSTNRIVHTRAWGALTDNDLIDHLNRIRLLFTLGTLDESWRQVADFSDVKSFEAVSAAGVRRIAEENPWPRRSLRVVVAPQTVAFGLARMYQLIGAGSTDNIRLTRKSEEAVALVER